MSAGASFICRRQGAGAARPYRHSSSSGREALLERLASVAKKLEGTTFAFTEHNDHVEAICPWGNRMRCYEPDAARFGRITLGIPYVEFDVPVGTAKAICAFYPEIMGMPAEFLNGDGTVARGQGRQGPVSAVPRDRPARSRNSTAITCRSTSRISPVPTARLLERDLISQEDNQYQYRFRDIVDLDSGKHLFTVEHEVRSATHPMFMRPLVNRNPAETNRTYAPGHEQWAWAMGPDEYDRR